MGSKHELRTVLWLCRSGGALILTSNTPAPCMASMKLCTCIGTHWGKKFIFARLDRLPTTVFRENSLVTNDYSDAWKCIPRLPGSQQSAYGFEIRLFVSEANGDAETPCGAKKQPAPYCSESFSLPISSAPTPLKVLDIQEMHPLHFAASRKVGHGME